MSARVCGHCGAENDDTRVFCADCGTRLPELPAASGGASSAAGKSAPPLPGTFRSKSKGPQRPPGSGSRSVASVLFWQLVSVLVTGAILAAIVQMARRPDQIPPMMAPDPGRANATFDAMRAGASAAGPSSWVLNQAAINEYLATTIQMKSSDSPSIFRAEYVRTFVTLQEGAFDLVIQQKFLGGECFFRLHGVPETSPSGVGAQFTGASIGRLPVHPALLRLMDPLFRQVFLGLEQTTDELRKAKDVVITPSEVTFQWPGAGSPSL